MDSGFELKLRAAVSAGWRVLVAEVGLLTLVWVVYLIMMATHPAFMLDLWGPYVSWSVVATVTLQAVALYKVALWLQAGLLAWAALWASRLRAMREAGGEANREPARREVPTAG